MNAVIGVVLCVRTKSAHYWSLSLSTLIPLCPLRSAPARGLIGRINNAILIAPFCPLFGRRRRRRLSHAPPDLWSTQRRAATQPPRATSASGFASIYVLLDITYLPRSLKTLTRFHRLKNIVIKINLHYSIQ
jgi:hypothetical protein